MKFFQFNIGKVNRQRIIIKKIYLQIYERTIFHYFLKKTKTIQYSIRRELTRKTVSQYLSKNLILSYFNAELESLFDEIDKSKQFS